MSHSTSCSTAAVPSVDAFAGPVISPSLALVRTDQTRPVRRKADRGLVSAEWAMAIIAAVAIVGVLVAVVGSGPVKATLTQVIVAVLKKAIGLL